MTFESHHSPELNVQDHAISIINGRHDLFRACFPSQPEEETSIEFVEPWNTSPHLVRVNPTPQDTLHVRCFAGQDWRAGELPEIGVNRTRADIALPTFGKPAGQVECRPAETW
jgi:hypothetical protein